jgi:hypothetical protein
MGSVPMIEAATTLVAAARSSGATTRVLGGIGVALRCPSASDSGALTRDYSDIDLVTTRDAGPVLSRTLEGLGYAPERRFNSMHGHSRMLFDHPDGTHVDVFVDQFVMCHRLHVSSRLALHDTTLSLADLLLTKLQIAELNEKDVTDAAALLLDHDLTGDEDGINVEYITGVLCRDWGWWRTVSHNLRALPVQLTNRLPEAAASRVAARAEQLLDVIETAPKSLRWKARAKAGERIPWREQPEESH